MSQYQGIKRRLVVPQPQRIWDHQRIIFPRKGRVRRRIVGERWTRKNGQRDLGTLEATLQLSQCAVTFKVNIPLEDAGGGGAVCNRGNEKKGALRVSFFHRPTI